MPKRHRSKSLERKNGKKGSGWSSIHWPQQSQAWALATLDFLMETIEELNKDTVIHLKLRWKGMWFHPQCRWSDPVISFQSWNPVAVPSRPVSSWQFCSLSHCPFSSPFPWRMCFLCPCQRARSEAACSLCWSKSRNYWPSWQTWGHCL